MSDNEFVSCLIEDQASDHCDQLEMYYEEAEEVFNNLKNLLPKSEDAESYGQVNREKAPALSPEEPLGYLAVYPGQNAGISMVIHSNPKTMKNSVKAVFPFIGEGGKFWEKGYRDITCMPMLLLPGAHSIKEIPETIESFKNIHSDCAITLLPCLAKNHDFVAFLAKLMEKCHG